MLKEKVLSPPKPEKMLSTADREMISKFKERYPGWSMIRRVDGTLSIDKPTEPNVSRQLEV